MIRARFLPSPDVLRWISAALAGGAGVIAADGDWAKAGFFAAVSYLFWWLSWRATDRGPTDVKKEEVRTFATVEEMERFLNSDESRKPGVTYRVRIAERLQ